MASRRLEKIYDFVIDEWMAKDNEIKADEERNNNNNNQRKDFLHFLLRFKEQDISREQIKAMLMVIFRLSSRIFTLH